MNPAATGIVILVLVVGSVLGWHSQKSYAAHGDVKVAKGRLAGGRRTRWRSAVWVLALVVVVLLIFVDVLRY
jgi:hypothetical protein